MPPFDHKGAPVAAYLKVRGGLVAKKACLTLETSKTVACQVPLSMGFPRQEYWSGLPCSSVHGISQARILEWVAISFSRGSS